MSADTSAAERIRRLKAKAIAVSVASGIPLPIGHGYEPVAALKLGHSAAVVETPAGPVIQPGCGCGSSSQLRITCTSGPVSIATVPTELLVSVQSGEIWSLMNSNGEKIASGDTAQTVPITVADTYALLCTTPIVTLSCPSSSVVTTFSPAVLDIQANTGQPWSLTGPSGSTTGVGPAQVEVTALGTYTLECTAPASDLQCGVGTYNITGSTDLTPTVPTNGAYITDSGVSWTSAGPTPCAVPSRIPGSYTDVTSGTYTISPPDGTDCTYPGTLYYTLLCKDEQNRIIISECSERAITIPYEPFGDTITLAFTVGQYVSYQIQYFDQLGQLQHTSNIAEAQPDFYIPFSKFNDQTTFIQVSIRCGRIYDISFNCDTLPTGDINIPTNTYGAVRILNRSDPFQPWWIQTASTRVQMGGLIITIPNAPMPMATDRFEELITMDSYIIVGIGCGPTPLLCDSTQFPGRATAYTAINTDQRTVLIPGDVGSASIEYSFQCGGTLYEFSPQSVPKGSSFTFSNVTAPGVFCESYPIYYNYTLTC